jgi:Tfp pilus assembly protein PilN
MTVPPALRKYLCIGSGVGIAVEGSDLVALAARLRPSGASVLGVHRIERFRERPASEWGAGYSAWLAGLGLRQAAAMFLLPRSEVLARIVPLPGVSDEDAPQAIEYQLDGLHPYAEEDAAAEWQRLDGSSDFLVAIAEQRTVEAWIALFAEAGIRLAGITWSGAAVYRALRLYGAPAARGFMAACGLHAALESPLEVYGESEARRLFSAEFETAEPRLLDFARAELRLDDAAVPADLADLLPQWRKAGGGVDSSDAGRSRAALAWAAALAASGQHLGPVVNFLPPGLRSGVSRAVYIPTAVLSLLLVVLVSALAAEDSWLNRQYLDRLNAETRRLDPVAKKVEALDREAATLAERIQQIEDFRKVSRANLDALLELTRLLPPPAWANSVQLTRTQVVVGGEVEQADALLRKLDESPLFQGSEFVMPIARMGQAETFRIRAGREGAPPPPKEARR